ncbi:hypothetical protein [Mesorhizobium sp. BE184]|uniref:hypothetical protein n=1 Tax=Mesorhizobium sp. BE184 TaxID=2817714 RepID=UPI002862CE4A|nr:hypothetical protein [Mesorhizobium sp. BE184]MDR7035246.1 hypothetical protein [Mesorhizobium sp. BE184]
MAKLGNCVFCQKVIREGQLYHHGIDEIACEACAPSYGDMLAEPGSFRDFQTDEPLTAEQAKAAIDAHLAKGGALTDKMVSA